MRPAVRVLSPLLLLLPLAAFGGTTDPALSTPPPADVADDAPESDDVADDETDGEDVDDESDGDEQSLATNPAAPHARPPHGGCPTGMSRTGEGTCMDRFEAPNRAGARPLVMQTARDAEGWCEQHHKRLCTEDEWIAACEGEEHHSYPYGDEHEDGRCNDDKEWRQVNESVLAKWPDDEARRHANELYQAARSGSKRGCKTRTGVSDLTGNVEEWVTRTRAHANGYPQILIGCYWSGCYGGGKPTCRSTNGAHGPEFRFYETGFRCCKDPSTTATRRRREPEPPATRE